MLLQELQAKKLEEKKAQEERSKVPDTRTLDELLSFIEDDSSKKGQEAAKAKAKKKKKSGKGKKESETGERKQDVCSSDHEQVCLGI